MKKLLLITGAAISVLVSGCHRAEEPSIMIIYHGGDEYRILARGDTVDDGVPAYFVRYYSKGIADENVLATEQSDLCALIAKHIDTNKHQRVTITAVERKGRLFGLMEPREVSESLTLAEVLKHYSGATAPVGQ